MGQIDVLELIRRVCERKVLIEAQGTRMIDGQTYNIRNTEYNLSKEYK